MILGRERDDAWMVVEVSEWVDRGMMDEDGRMGSGEQVDECMVYSDLDKDCKTEGDQNYFQLDVLSKILKNHKIFI